MAKKKFYIKKRINPQLPRPYYSAMGQMALSEAKRWENPICGQNIMLSYDTEDEYASAVDYFIAKSVNQ